MHRALAPAAARNGARDDRILLSTRLLAAAVVPVLLVAFAVLYFAPEETGQRFAWPVAPRIMAMYIGAGYLGGAYLFAHALVGRRWHRVAAGFLPITAFTVSMLLITVLYWDRVDLNHFPFQVWLVLYAVTPVLVPLAYLMNRRTDDGRPEAGDVEVPAVARWSLGLLGGALLVLALLAFVWPDSVVGWWPWRLTPMTARMLGGWNAILGLGGLLIARDRRWSAWRVGLESIALWHVLVLFAVAQNPGDFAGLANGYVAGVVLILIGMAILYGAMELRRRRRRHAGGAQLAAP